jgi:hypothetical protein
VTYVPSTPWTTDAGIIEIGTGKQSVRVEAGKTISWIIKEAALEVYVKDQAGNPVKDAEVSLYWQRHDGATFLLKGSAKRTDGSGKVTYRWLAPNSGYWPKYVISISTSAVGVSKAVELSPGWNKADITLAFEIKIVDFSIPKWVYKTGDKVTVTFSIRETLGKLDVKIWPRLVIVGPALPTQTGERYVVSITGDPITIKAGTTTSSSLEWAIPNNALAGTYGVILDIWDRNPSDPNAIRLDVKAKDFAFVVDKGISYIEVEPFYPPWGVAKGIHIHIASKDIERSGSFGTVINIKEKGIGPVIALLTLAKIIVGDAITDVPSWLSLLATAQDIATLQQAPYLNPDGSLDVLFLEITSGIGYMYMGVDFKAVGTLTPPTSLAYVSLPKDIPLPYYAELLFPIEFIAETISKGYNYLVSSVGYTPPKVTVIWGEDLSTLNVAINIRGLQIGVISIGGKYGWDPDAILHEYGHWIMFNVYGGLERPSYGPDNVHYWDSKENPYAAWVEGWASFFACAVQNESVIQFLGVDLESQEPKGEDVEGAVAGVLWDIFDKNNDGADTISLGLSPIWKIIVNYKPKSITEFYDGWKKEFKDYVSQVTAILIDHGIVVAPLIDIQPKTWSDSVEAGKSISKIFTVSAIGRTVKGVTVTKISGPNWITVSPTSLGDIPAGSSKTFTVTASPPAGTTGSFNYLIRVTCTEGEPKSIDISGTITVTLPPVGKLIVNIHNYGNLPLPKDGGSMRVLLFTSDLSKSLERIVSYKGGEGYVTAEFDVTSGDYVVFVDRMPSGGLGFVEYWGELSVKSPGIYDFYRHTQVITDVNVNKDIVSIGESVEISVKVKNIEPSNQKRLCEYIGTRVKLILDRDKAEPWDYEVYFPMAPPSIKIPYDGGVENFLFTYTPKNPGTYYLYVLSEGNYYNIMGKAVFEGTDQYGWVKAFTVTSPTDTVPPSVKVISPNGGETWNVGETRTITWTASDNVGVNKVDISYSTDGGKSWIIIATNLPNTGSYQWKIPSTPSTNCLIRIEAYDGAGNKGSDISDGTFTITSTSLNKGDLDNNGAIDAVDLVLMKKIILGMKPPVDFNHDGKIDDTDYNLMIKAADMNDDGKVDAIDLVLLKKVLLKS